jgi:hypothetical protein
MNPAGLRDQPPRNEMQQTRASDPHHLAIGGSAGLLCAERSGLRRVGIEARAQGLDAAGLGCFRRLGLVVFFASDTAPSSPSSTASTS